MIRHGETTENARGAISTIAPGPELTDMGRRQAAAIPAALGEERVEAIYASTLRRTSMTATPLAERLELPIRVIAGIEEIHGGVWEHRADQEAMRGYISPLISWWSDRSARIQGGEDGHDFFARFDPAIARIAREHEPDATVAIFSHGAALRVWCAWSARNISEEDTQGLRLDNTGMVIMEGSPADGWEATLWHTDPIGGPALLDGHPDPAGEAPLTH